MFNVHEHNIQYYLYLNTFLIFIISICIIEEHKAICKSYCIITLLFFLNIIIKQIFKELNYFICHNLGFLITALA